MLFVAKSVALGLFVASWFARRAGTSNAERNKLLRRLHLLMPPMKMKGGLRVASYEQRRLLLSPVEDASLYELVVVDEAHHVYSHSELRECVKPYADAASRLLLLSDASQSLGALCDYPTGLKEVALTEVVRSSQRIVNGANAFRCGDFDAKGDASRSDDRPRCHHQVPGPPLLPILFDSCGKEERMQQYATQTVVALKRVKRDFPGLRLHNRLALIVPDAAFCKDFEQLLQDALNDAFHDVRFHLINAEEASACVLGTAAEPGVETLVLDTVEQFDGLERLIVIAIGLDAPIDNSEGTLETRSRLYRALTRAHMMALVVNEKLRGGWLEFLGNVDFDGLDAGVYDAEAQERMQSNAAAVITAKTLAIRDEVQKAATQRQLSLAPVVHEAIVRQVQKVTSTGEATAATKITTLLNLCEEKLPAIKKELQVALAASSYCSEALPQELHPDVMLAVLDGEEVAAAVQKVVMRAEEEVVARAEAATQADNEVTVLDAQTDQADTKRDQGPRQQQQAPEKEKQTQGVWDTSNVSGWLELAADGFNPYARGRWVQLLQIGTIPIPLHWLPFPLSATASPGLDAAWPATPRKGETHFRLVYAWEDSTGCVPPRLCEKVVAAFQGVAACRYLRDNSGGALVWQRGALLELGGATVKLEMAPLSSVVKEGEGLLLQLVADARGTDEVKVRALLETGDVHVALGSVLAGLPGLRMSSEAVVTRMQDKRMRSAVAVTVGNRYSVYRQVDCQLSAQELNAALQGRGLRVEAPWIDQPGGKPMLDRLRQVLASKVRPTDDGFVFCFGGHGGATELVGNDNVPTSYQVIIDAIATEPKLQGKPKLVVFDCGRGNTTSEAGQLRIPKDMILAHSTIMGSDAFNQSGVGLVYSTKLAAAIRSHAATHSVEDLLKLTGTEVQGIATPRPQIAQVDSALGAYHLFLGTSAPSAAAPVQTFATPAKAAAALVAALEAHAPDAEVLPLITKEAATTEDQVSLHS